MKVKENPNVSRLKRSIDALERKITELESKRDSFEEECCEQDTWTNREADKYFSFQEKIAEAQDEIKVLRSALAILEAYYDCGIIPD